MSSPWVLSSSNIYFNTGAVGIGSSAPTRALDVNGSVAVSGSVAATAYAGISTSFSGVTNVTINIDLSTYQMVEIILNVGFSGANYPDLQFKENSSSNFNYTYGGIFTKFNNLLAPLTDSTNALMKNCEAGGSYQFGGSATIRMYKPPVPGATSSVYPIEAHGTYTYGGLGPASLAVLAAHVGSTPLPSIYLATSNGALMSGTYIVHNNL